MSKATPLPELTAEEVIERVRARLVPHQPADNALDVLPQVTHKEGRWWYVIVSPDRSDIPLAEYNVRMEKVERDLKKMDNANVVLLPVVPDWMANPQ